MVVVAFFFGLRVGCGPDDQDEVPFDPFSTESVRDSYGFKEYAPHSSRGDVILQLFNWPFTKITEEIPLLAERGYGQIHVSPPNLTIDSDMWWGRYQPLDYRIIAGPLGDETQFKQMIVTAHQFGVKILVDLVLNHTANESFIPRNLPPQAQKVLQDFGPLFTPDDYHPAACITDYNDVVQVRKNRLCGAPGDKGLPDLDQNSPRVLAAQKAFVAKLTALGVDGFRLDAVKHMDPGYFNKLIPAEERAKFFIFGEIITDPKSYDRDLVPYLKETSFSYYDFPLRATIQDAFRFGGRLSDLLATDLVATKRALPSDRSVTFVMAHDIPNNEIFRSMILDPVDEMLAYGYLLGRAEGVPYIYSDLGKAGGAGLRDDRWAFAHRDPLLAHMLRFRKMVQGTPQTNLFADDCVIAFARGTQGVVAINKCGDPREVSLDVSSSNFGSFRDLITGAPFLQTYPSQGPRQTVKVPGRSARLYVSP